LEFIVYFAKSLPTASAERKILAQLRSFYEWYASAGLTEATARERHDVVTTVVHFDSTIRTIIDGRKIGFCKLIVDRKTAKILGCHVVGERAVEIAQVAAIAIAAGMRVDDLARVPLAFPTYTGNLAYAAADAARQLDLQVSWQSTKVEGNNVAKLRAPAEAVP
jgi:pyruvate/2-oxoglutarate dehydrogenase complex dihydrolipoamide dehydrogenase (E3) component